MFYEKLDMHLCGPDEESIFMNSLCQNYVIEKLLLRPLLRNRKTLAKTLHEHVSLSTFTNSVIRVHFTRRNIVTTFGDLCPNVFLTFYITLLSYYEKFPSKVT